MENTKKKTNAYAKLFAFFKSKTVRNIVSAVLLIVSLFTMLIIDEKNYVRKKFFAFLDNQKIANIFSYFKIEKFDVKFTAWLIFAALFIACSVLLIGNIFSGPIIKSMVSKYGKKKSENKGMKIGFTVAYNVLLLGVSAIIIYIFFLVGNVGDYKKFASASGDVFLNLLYTLLITLGVIVAILVAILIVLLVIITIFVIIAKIASPSKCKCAEKANAVEEKTEEAEEVKVTETVDETAEEEVVETAEETPEEITEEATEETENEAKEVAEETTEETAPETENKSAVEIIDDSEEDENADNSAENEEFKFSGDSPRLKTSFLCRLIQAEKETTDYYSQIKNHILSYKGVNSRISWNCDSFNKGRSLCAKLNVRGKSVILYVALDPKDYSVSKYHHSDVSDKSKHARTPMMLRIRSARALKYATELVSIWMEKNGVKQGEVKNVDYALPYATNDALLERGLIKRV